MPESWRVISRVENGGYGNQSGNVNVNKKRSGFGLVRTVCPSGISRAAETSLVQGRVMDLTTFDGVLIGGRLEQITGLCCTRLSLALTLRSSLARTVPREVHDI